MAISRRQPAAAGALSAHPMIGARLDFTGCHKQSAPFCVRCNATCWRDGARVVSLRTAALTAGDRLVRRLVRPGPLRPVRRHGRSARGPARTACAGACVRAMRPTAAYRRVGWRGRRFKRSTLQDPVPIEFGVSVISTASRGPKRASSVEPFPPFLRTREHEPGRPYTCGTALDTQRLRPHTCQM